METKENERVAICSILLDIMEGIKLEITIVDCRHYSSLKEKVGLCESDFEKAGSASVLSSLVILKSMHYNKKMLMALTVCDLYSECTHVSLSHRIAFETLMNAIDWPISFSEILAISGTV